MNSASTPNHAGHDDTTHNAALRGAFLAFQKTAKPAITRPSTPTRDAGNGGLTQSSPVSRQTTGNNSALGRDQSFASHHSLSHHAHLLTPSKPTTGDPRSPSLIAATLAASRSVSPSPKATPSVQTSTPQATRDHRKGIAGHDSTVSSVTDLDLATDVSSIGPTNALISLFERKEDDTDPVKKSPAVPSVKKGLRAGLRPMTPPRVTSPVVSSPSTGRDIVRVKSPLRGAQDAGLAVSASLFDPARKPPLNRPPLKAAGRATTSVLSPRPKQASSYKVIGDSSNTSTGSATPPVAKPVKHRPYPMSRTRAQSVTSLKGERTPGALVRRSSSSLSNDTFVSASSAPSPQPDSPRRISPHQPSAEASQPPRPQSVNTTSAPPLSRPLMLKSSSNLPLDSLTNAIVAGSLASARATPAKPPTPPPRKQTPHMRQTLRAPRTKSDEEVNGTTTRYKKKPLGKLSSRKKHAHHEGSRRRWREVITARERQRYEGLWASNRGLLLDDPGALTHSLQNTDTSQLVANVVVRDIWARSRLPFDELAEVWDLVDTQGRDKFYQHYVEDTRHDTQYKLRSTVTDYWSLNRDTPSLAIPHQVVKLSMLRAKHSTTTKQVADHNDNQTCGGYGEIENVFSFALSLHQYMLTEVILDLEEAAGVIVEDLSTRDSRFLYIGESFDDPLLGEFGKKYRSTNGNFLQYLFSAFCSIIVITTHKLLNIFDIYVTLEQALMKGHDEPLQQKLKERGLSNDTIEEALSYVWGNSIFDKSINISGKAFSMTTNLNSILHNLRHPNVTRTIRIDATCITNQIYKRKRHQALKEEVLLEGSRAKLAFKYKITPHKRSRARVTLSPSFSGLAPSLKTRSFLGFIYTQNLVMPARYKSPGHASAIGYLSQDLDASAIISQDLVTSAKGKRCFE
ncbi:hypothetical protein FHL15_004280 [Xylaria flabelliformis]|uniref:Heterokaryon incompatibility domain-containing protein n=1 Tax=Xylaria flabelliformis TaxID=2512241 RepID=A0A553I3P3_9PEZI|nr:hypothetical protein FHL15_004280 [Xylaria flabelliformis]